jgi:hypothetical protein
MSDNRLGEGAAASVAASLKGSVVDGLRSFAFDHLIGPTSVSGTLQEKRRLYREKKLSERQCRAEEEERVLKKEREEEEEAAKKKVPPIPKFNMLHSSL